MRKTLKDVKTGKNSESSKGVKSDKESRATDNFFPGSGQILYLWNTRINTKILHNQNISIKTMIKIISKIKSYAGFLDIDLSTQASPKHRELSNSDRCS